MPYFGIDCGFYNRAVHFRHGDQGYYLLPSHHFQTCVCPIDLLQHCLQYLAHKDWLGFGKHSCSGEFFHCGGTAVAAFILLARCCGNSSAICGLFDAWIYDGNGRH